MSAYRTEIPLYVEERSDEIAWGRHAGGDFFPPTPVDALASQSRADHRRALARTREARRRLLLRLLLPVAIVGAVLVGIEVTTEHPSPALLTLGGALVLPWLVELGARR